MILSDRAALVTGAATRLGRAIALALAREGVRVAIHYRHSEAEAHSTLEEARVFQPGCFLIQGDLSHREDIERISDTAESRLQGVDILINNASLFPARDGLQNFDLGQWDQLFNTNLYAPFVMSRKLFAARREGSREGAIVNLIDAGLNHAAPDFLVYRLTKAALKEMTSLLALELAPSVRVNGIGPGSILPPARSNEKGRTIRPDSATADRLFREHIQRDVPLRRPGSPEIVADNVLHLLRQDFLTGVILPVDGGEFI